MIAKTYWNFLKKNQEVNLLMTSIDTEVFILSLNHIIDEGNKLLSSWFL
jgi:hypothetical protein